MRAGRPVDFIALAEKTAAGHSEPSCRPLVGNAVATLSEHLWTGHEILGVEEPFFLDLSEELPPVIGVVDLILRDGPRFLAMDHKRASASTTKTKGSWCSTRNTFASDTGRSAATASSISIGWCLTSPG